MFLDDEAFEWFAVRLKHYGREKGLQYMKRVGIYFSGHTALDLKDKDAPIDWVALDPYFAQANMLMLAKHAPHPYAAALFMDWGLSEKGQAMITTFGRVVARTA
jgi:iron(III) transport system substrate-binding protein